MQGEKHLGGKDVLVREQRRTPASGGYHIFAAINVVERWIKDTIFRFHKSKKDDLIMAATNLFGDVFNILLRMETEKHVDWSWSMF